MNTPSDLRTRGAAYLADLRGWRGKLACFIAGAITALGFAPFNIVPVLLITIPFLFLMLDKARHWRSAALYGWAFGYGYMMAGTYWIANALRVDAEQFGWLIPISILGLSLVMGIWFALFGALYRALRTGQTDVDVLRFATLFVAVEYLRSIGPFGFPWNLTGSMVLASERVAQLLSILGTFGVGLFILLIALWPVLWWRQHPRRQTALAGTLILLIAAYGYGMWRMPVEADIGGPRVRVVQPNIPQTLKWTPQGRIESLEVHARLSRLISDSPVPAITIWPETAVPFTLREGYASSVPVLIPGMAADGLLITGAMRSTGGVADYRLYNSIVALNGQGDWLDSYDKHQLVPFGEFVPLRSVLPIEKITPGGTDFSRGPGPRTVRIDNLPPYQPLVCYEVVFPWLSASSPGERPAWLVNATNDAWYGMSPGPFQHFDATRLRAVEQGLPVVRAANTGISAVIDPYGRAIKRLELDERGIIDQALPRPLPPTIYAQFGEWTALTLLVVIWIVTKILLFRRKN